MAAPAIGRQDVLRFRFRRQQLDREPETASEPTDVALLDYGVQDTGPDGAAWALALRGLPPAGQDDVAFAWTLRGAPHAYRRCDLADVAVATAPLSEGDAAKRIFDAAKPLAAAGIPPLVALRVVAGHLRDIVTSPMVKGDVSGRLTALVDEPYLRACRPCGTTHVYELPFRLAALQAGLELEPDTSPPVLHRIPGIRPQLYGRLGFEADPRFDVIRNYLRFYGPARIRDVAGFLDARAKDLEERWPAEAVEVVITDVPPAGRRVPRFVLAEDLEALGATGSDDTTSAVRLVAPHDPYLQFRDRDLLVTDEARRKYLWPVLGRPGAMVADGEIVGTWRPRASGRKLSVRIEPWRPLEARRRAEVEEQAERLAACRGVILAGIAEE